MTRFFITTAITLLASLNFTFAQPLQVITRDAGAIVTEAQILAIAPKSGTCAGGNPECRTASQAAQSINTVFDDYRISSPGEKAALISLMAFESADFQFQRNQVPGRPGQGTRAMLMPEHVTQLAIAIPAIQGALSPVMNDPVEVLNEVLTNDVYDFASAAWFLQTQCSKDIEAGLQTGGLAGWQNYITSCVSTTATSDRQEYYERALKAFGSGS